jgi:hypothetical protein
LEKNIKICFKKELLFKERDIKENKNAGSIKTSNT